MKLVKDGHAFGKNRAASHGEAVLRKVAGRNAFGARDRPIIERFASGQDLHNRRFARAVCSDQTNARFRRNQPVSVFEQKLMAVALARAGKLDHEVSLFQI